jgi:hypothetical protein
MNAIVLPNELEAWAEAEVAAGRAKSVEQLAADALEDYRRRLEDFRRSLDEAVAEADANGWLTHEEVFDALRRRHPATE